MAVKKTENPYEKELDDLINSVNANGDMPVDMMQVVLTEFNARMQAKILVKLEEISKKL